jgi:hypothetical protein
MEILNEEDFAELPEEPAHKWIQLEKTASARLLALLQTATDAEADHLKTSYMSMLTNLASVYDVEGISISSETTIDRSYSKFLLTITIAKSSIWARSAATYPNGRVKLSDSVRLTILELITQIEANIDSLDYPPHRLRALHSCIADFRREINQPKTRIASALSSLAQIAAVAVVSTTALADGPDAYATIQRILGAEQVNIAKPEVLLIEKEKQTLLPPPTKLIENQATKGQE